MTSHDSEVWARRVLLLFALCGLLHVPAFYWLVWVEANRQSPPVVEACPAPKGAR